MSDNAISCAETAQQKKKNIFPINETIVRQKNSTVKGHTKSFGPLIDFFPPPLPAGASF